MRNRGTLQPVFRWMLQRSTAKCNTFLFQGWWWLRNTWSLARGRSDPCRYRPIKQHQWRVGEAWLYLLRHCQYLYRWHVWAAWRLGKAMGLGDLSCSSTNFVQISGGAENLKEWSWRWKRRSGWQWKQRSIQIRRGEYCVRALKEPQYSVPSISSMHFMNKLCILGVLMLASTTFFKVLTTSCHLHLRGVFHQE